MPAHESRYSLRELLAVAAETEGGSLDERAARDYIAAGLLPPTRAATAQPYGEEHLLRLRMIVRLSRQYVPLKEIQRFLERLPPTGLRALLDRSPLVRLPSEGDAQLYLQRLLETVPPSMRTLVIGPHPVPAVSLAPSPPVRSRDVPSGPQPPATPEMQRSEWLRVAVDPDVELLVRVRRGHNAHKLADRLTDVLRRALAMAPDP